ncbi:MAG: hypothetical protein ABI747_04575 [Candidatus Moraniibacteriota bacterium]
MDARVAGTELDFSRKEGELLRIIVAMIDSQCIAYMGMQTPEYIKARSFLFCLNRVIAVERALELYRILRVQVNLNILPSKKEAKDRNAHIRGDISVLIKRVRALPHRNTAESEDWAIWKTLQMLLLCFGIDRDIGPRHRGKKHIDRLVEVAQEYILQLGYSSQEEITGANLKKNE